MEEHEAVNMAVATSLQNMAACTLTATVRSVVLILQYYYKGRLVVQQI